LPKDTRLAFTLVNIEGFSVDEASMVLNKKPEEIDRLLQDAEDHLAQKFRKDETTMPKEQLRKVYQRIRSLPFRISIEERVAAFEKMIAVTE